MNRLDLSVSPSRLAQIYCGPRPDIGISQGDCCRTVLAMLLGAASPEDVPHFEEWDDHDKWLRDRGAQLVHFPLFCKTPDCLAEHLSEYLHGCPALLSGQTAEGHQHCVAVIDNQIVDTVPYTTGNPLVAPTSNGLYWLTLLVPVRGVGKDSQ